MDFVSLLAKSVEFCSYAASHSPSFLHFFSVRSFKKFLLKYVPMYVCLRGY